MMESQCHHCDMSNVTKIYASKQGRRPHHVQDWAERRGYSSQAELAEALGADKSLVSRWYAGATPGRAWQEKLAAAFSLDDVESLFRDPDEDWLARFFAGRNFEERQRIIATLETAFPRRNGTNN